MRIAIDINDVIQVVRGATDEYHVVLGGPSGQALLAAWEQKQRDDDVQPTLEL